MLSGDEFYDDEVTSGPALDEYARGWHEGVMAERKRVIALLSEAGGHRAIPMDPDGERCALCGDDVRCDRLGRWYHGMER
jgi:hypothetical protein